MPNAKTNKFLRFLTLNLHSSIDIALISLGLFSLFMGVRGFLTTGWSDSIAIAWSISSFFEAIAGAAMIGATICSIGSVGRIVSAIAVGYCICHSVYLDLTYVPTIIEVIVLLALLVEAFLSRRVDLRTPNLKDGLERNALRVKRLVVIPLIPFVVFSSLFLALTFRPAVGTLAWRETEAHLVSTNDALAQTNSQTPRYSFEVDGKNYLLLHDSDPQAMNSTFHLEFRGNASRRSGKSTQSISTDSKGVQAILPTTTRKQPAPKQSFAVVYNPNSPSDNAESFCLLPSRLIFGFFLTVFSLFSYLTYKVLNGTRLQFIEPDPKFWSSKPYVKIADLPATAT